MRRIPSDTLLLPRCRRAQAAAIRPVTVTFSAGEGGTLTAMVDGVEISSGDKVVYGKEVVFTATPETGYSIGSWSGISGSGNPVEPGG